MVCHHGMVLRLREAQRRQSSIHDRTFGRLFERNPIVAPTDLDRALDLLSALADAMRDEENKTGSVDAGQTFLGQFIDHDVTLDVTSRLTQRIAVSDVANQRTPTLDLDCVLGGGSEATPLLYSMKHAHYLLVGTFRNPGDLARNVEGIAIIGDPRNDENAFVAAVQGLFIRFYNVLLHKLEAGDATFTGEALKGETATDTAVRLLRWHYHDIILHEFLPAFVAPGILEKVLHRLRHGRLPKGFRDHDAYIPAEFSVAAYRFGHATVQSTYDIGGGEVIKLFANDGQPDGLPAFGPKEKTIDLERFFSSPTEPDRAQKARPIGPRIAAELFDLPFVTGGIDGPPEVSLARAKSLAHRNIIRDRFSFELASGQQAAADLGLTPLDRDGPTRAAGLHKIPLWYYCLQEGDSNEGKLGEVGGTIVAGVLGRLLRDDPLSAWHAPDWRSPLAAGGRFTMGTMVDYVAAEWGSIPFADELMSPRTTDFVTVS